MTDIVIIIVLVVILGCAISYMRKERPKGVTCIGCPDAHACEMRKNGQTCQGNNVEM
ncbi:MAG: hypothetical protein IJO60_11185 [Agathobacter sp.]|nr:hypothetical protein [Agathobacter sp.]